MIEGLRRSNERDYGYLIYTADLEVLIDYEFGLGEYDDRVNDDVADFDAIKEKLSLNPGNLEPIIMNAAAHNTENSRPVKTAIICPAAVYGFGKGPIKRYGGILKTFIRATMFYKNAFRVGKGNNHSSVVDIDNLAKAYLFLIEKALRPRAVEGGHWDSEGYYFVETGDIVRMIPMPVLWPADNQVLGRLCERRWGTDAAAIFCR